VSGALRGRSGAPEPGAARLSLLVFVGHGGEEVEQIERLSVGDLGGERVEVGVQRRVADFGVVQTRSRRCRSTDRTRRSWPP
jgi:hypothetical protein